MTVRTVHEHTADDDDTARSTAPLPPPACDLRVTFVPTAPMYTSSSLAMGTHRLYGNL